MEFSGILGLILQYKYGLLILVTAVEGPIAMLAAGFLINLGLISLPLALAAVVAGDLIGDTFWYVVGHFARHSVILRFGTYIGLTEERFQRLEAVFQKHTLAILVTSKLTMGLGFSIATLMVAGAARVRYSVFFVINLIAGVVWSAFLVTLGYYFGNLYLVAEDLGSRSFVAGVFLFVVLVGFVLIRYIRATFGKKYLS